MASPEDLLVGLVCLALLPLIAMRVLRGFRDGRLPLYRTRVAREEAGAKFNLLLVLHALSFLLVAVIAADLLLDLGIRSSL